MLQIQYNCQPANSLKMDCSLLLAQKQTLSSILRQPSTPATKIAQLQAFKQSLKTLLKRKHQQKIMHLHKNNQQTQLSTKHNTALPKDTHQSVSSIYGLGAGQQKEVKHFIASICKLFSHRKHLNSTHFQLQKLNQSLQKKYLKPSRQPTFQSISKLVKGKQAINAKLRQLLSQFKSLAFTLHLCAQMYHDLTKVYKVRYVLLKSKRNKQLNKQRDQNILQRESFELKDENSNQILVNM